MLPLHKIESKHIPSLIGKKKEDCEKHAREEALTGKPRIEEDP